MTAPIGWLEQSPSRRVTAIVTFDDGYASVASAALPVLQRLRVPATVFVVAGRIGGDNQWPGQSSSIGRAPLLDAGALRELTAAGVALGCHSLTHPRLTSLDDAAAATEISDAADRLEHLAQVAVRHFAYPYGVRGSREVAPLAVGIARLSAHRAASSIASPIRSTCLASTRTISAWRFGWVC